MVWSEVQELGIYPPLHLHFLSMESASLQFTKELEFSICS